MSKCARFCDAKWSKLRGLHIDIFAINKLCNKFMDIQRATVLCICIIFDTIEALDNSTVLNCYYY